MSSNEKFDGVAVNNEAYGGIKCSDILERTTYLDNLQKIVDEADKQIQGKLLTHYSIGWHWGICDDINFVPDLFPWNGKNASANIHMIDIFDDVDVQVMIGGRKEARASP